MEPPCDIASMPRFGKQSQSGRVSSVKFPVLRRARRWSGLQTLHVTLQTWPKAGCTNKPNWPATPGGRRNSRFVGGDGVLARKTQNTVLAHVVFWCSGILGWRPEKRGSGAPAWCVFGTWHVAGWIFGAKTRGDNGDSLRRGDRLCKTKPIARSGAPRRCRGVGQDVEYPVFHYSIIPAFQFHAQSPQHHRCACLAGVRMLW